MYKRGTRDECVIKFAFPTENRVNASTKAVKNLRG